MVTPQELFAMIALPIPGHIFLPQDGDNNRPLCKRCLKLDLSASFIKQLASLPEVDKKVVEATKHVLALNEKTLERMPQTAPAFEFIKLFCNAHQEFGKDYAEFYLSGVWAGKARWRHAVQAYYQQLTTT